MALLGARTKGSLCNVLSRILGVLAVWLDPRTWCLEQGPQAPVTAEERERGVLRGPARGTQ